MNIILKISKNISISQIFHKNSQKNVFSNQEKIRCDEYVEELSESIIKKSMEVSEIDTLLAMKKDNERNVIVL